MAVDANVLIFERTKEELREGKNPREAVHIGFQSRVRRFAMVTSR